MTGGASYWATAYSRYGDASSVPETILRARAAEDPTEAHDLVADAVRHVTDGGMLEDAAPQLAEELLGSLGERPRHPASLLHGLLRLLEPGALRRGDARVIPVDGFVGFRGLWDERLQWPARAAQTSLDREVRSRIRTHGERVRQ
jgi:hypothetical protein